MIILINPFCVSEGRESDFLHLWDQTGAIFRRSKGYIGARLCKAAESQAFGQRAPFTHINIAEWESADHYDKALANPDIRRLAKAYAELSTFDPALYDIIRDQPPL